MLIMLYVTATNIKRLGLESLARTPRSPFLKEGEQSQLACHVQKELRRPSVETLRESSFLPFTPISCANGTRSWGVPLGLPTYYFKRRF